MPYTSVHGKICYLEIPALDIASSARFYEAAFGWTIRQRGDGSTAFDDPVREISGTWILGRTPHVAIGMLLYIMVEDAAAAIEKLQALGAEIVQPIGVDAPEITARFRDPAGNIFGIYQEPVPPPTSR